MTTKATAGRRLHDDLNTALQHAGQELGRDLEFDESERHIIDQAVAAVDSCCDSVVMH